MALMEPPNGVSPDDATEADAVVALDEDGNVEEENAEYSGIAAFVQSQFRRSKDRRLPSSVFFMSCSDGGQIPLPKIKRVITPP